MLLNSCQTSKFCFVLIVSTLFVTSTYDNVQGQKPLRVYVVAGQSNCVGAKGLVVKYPANSTDWRARYVYKTPDLPPDDFDINNPFDWKTSGYDSNLDIGTQFISHMGYPLSGNEPFNGHVGPEIQFSRWMRAEHPNEDIAIVKVAVGSTMMIEWEPARRFWDHGANNADKTTLRVNSSKRIFYQHLLPAVQNSINTFRQETTSSGSSRYSSVTLSGFVWVQGENDLVDYVIGRDQAKVDGLLSSNRTRAQLLFDYRQSFLTMVNALRYKPNAASVGNPNMAFAICLTQPMKDIEIKPSNLNSIPPAYRNQSPAAYKQRVERLIFEFHRMQRLVADNDSRGVWVSIKDLKLADNFHWDTPSLRDVGLRAGVVMSGVEQ